jgi:cell division protein FtsB
VVALAALGVVRAHIESQTQAALDRAAELEQENAELIDKIDSLGSSSSIEEIAKEELGLVRPDAVIINPNSQ